MKPKIANYVENENYKEGDKVVLYSQRFKNVLATIKELDQKSRIAKVVIAEGDEVRVDYHEMQDFTDQSEINLSDIMNQSVEQNNEYRPIGRGYGKIQDAFNIVGSALKKIEKDLGKLKMPVVAVKYESLENRKWHNAFNTLWEGNINFMVEFLDPNGVKHTATVKVPVGGGQLKEIDAMYDNLNRKYAFDQEGVQNFLSQIKYTIDDNRSDEAVWFNPGDEPTSASMKRTTIFKKSSLNDGKTLEILNKYSNAEDDVAEQSEQLEQQASKKVDLHKEAKQKLITAKNPLFHAKKFMDDDDYNEFQKLWSIRDMFGSEVRGREDENERRGLERNHKINYKKYDDVCKCVDNILDKCHGSINMYFFPEASTTVDRVLRNIKAKNKINKKAEGFDEANSLNNIEIDLSDIEQGVMESQNDPKYQESIYSVIVDGTKVNKEDLSWEDANALSEQYRQQGYENIQVISPTQANINKKAEHEILYEDEKGNKIGYDPSLRGTKYFIWYNDGNLSEYPIYYGDGEFGFDHPEQISEELKNKFKEIVIEREGIKEANIKKKAEEIDEQMDHEMDEDFKQPGKKKTHHKSVDKKEMDEYQQDSPVPAGTNNREHNDMSTNEPNETRFQS